MSDKRRGLGRGLGALIPSSASTNAAGSGTAPSRPVDLFFPEARKSAPAEADTAVEPSTTTPGRSSESKGPAAAGTGETTEKTVDKRRPAASASKSEPAAATPVKPKGDVSAEDGAGSEDAPVGACVRPATTSNLLRSRVSGLPKSPLVISTPTVNSPVPSSMRTIWQS